MRDANTYRDGFARVLAALPTGCILFAEALIVSMSCSDTPLRYGSPYKDSAVFRYVAFVMDKGGMPYRDTFDHKGPLTYFINYLGLRIDFWRGLWLFELLALFISVLFLYRAARSVASRFGAHVSVLFAFATLNATLSGGNYTEEWALPFMSITVWVLAEYLVQKKSTVLRMAVSGACCGAVLMLRPNMIACWMVLCFVVVFRCINAKDWRTFIRYGAWFAIGVFTVLLPIIVWLTLNDALGACINDYLLFNIKYTSGTDGRLAKAIGIVRVIFHFINNPITLLALLACVLSVVRHHQNAYEWLALLVVSLILCSISGRSYEHYGITLIPAQAMSLALVAPHFEQESFDTTLSCAVMSCVAIVSVLPTWIALSDNALTQCSERVGYSVTNTSAYGQITALIEAHSNENDKIVVCGNKDALYLSSKRLCASQYSFQTVGSVDPTIEDEFFAEVEQNKPSVVVVYDSYYAKEKMIQLLKASNYICVGTTEDDPASVWTFA